MSDCKIRLSTGEVLSRYQRGERDFRHSELDQGIFDFRGVNLSGADFSHSFIIADFREANLKLANFTHCNVKTCDFRGADLQGAIFRESCLEGTEFSGAVLIETDFEGASNFAI